MSDEAVTRTIVGQCEEISEKNGWTSFTINHGGQYPTKLSTKVGEIIEQARAVGSDTATWTFKESDGNENPNRPGTFYKNRYLSKVEPGAVAQEGTASGSTPVPTAHHDAIAPADRDRAIVRQTCLKAASALYSGREFTADDGKRDEFGLVNAVLAAASRYEIWIYRDIDEPVDGDDIPF